MLNKGDKAPNFEGNDQNGNPLSLAKLLEKGDVLVYFYPADFSPICTAQACAFRDRADALKEASVQIVGISPQSSASHERFSSTYELGFPLLADSSKRIVKGFGVDGPLGFGVRRATFLIGSDGLIRKRVVSDLFVGSHTDFIRSVLDDTPADDTQTGGNDR